MAAEHPRPAIAWPFPVGLGRVIALLVLIACFVLWIVSRLDPMLALLIGGVALAELIP